MNRRTTISRLRRLAEHLKKVEDVEFNMGEWCREDSCGTAACAWGHGATEPTFQKLGVKLRQTGGSSFWNCYTYVPEYRGVTGFEAAVAFFGITEAQASSLFMSTSYRRRPVRRQDVIRKIRALVARIEREAKVPA